MEFKGFVGSAYSAANILQDCQQAVNYYIEIDKQQDAKTVIALLGVPGLVDQGQSTYSGQVRGMWTLPGNATAVVVIGAQALLITISASGTQTSRPTLSYTLIGSLNSTVGVVKMRDNGAGKICVLVDGTNLYVYNISTGTFVISSDPAFLGSVTVAEIDGWFVFHEPASQVFYTSPLYWDGVKAFDGTYFALKDNAPDNIVGLIEQSRELWIIGEATTEVWYNAGGNYFPFSRLQGTLQQVGCSAAQSIARYGEGLIWLGRSERGNNQVLMTSGYGAKDIANPALAFAINQYPVINDAIGYCYAEEGHEFYVLIFPIADATWCYDLTTGEWHQRASFDPVAGEFHRQRTNCLMNFQGMQIAGDYSTGQIYWQTRSAYADGNYPLVAMRRAPHFWDKSDRNRIRYNRLQVEFTSGLATQTGQCSNPQAILRWSDDGGQTWGNDHFLPIGAAGQTTNRVICRRMGIARDRVFELRVSDPVNRDIVGASLQIEPLGA